MTALEKSIWKSIEKHPADVTCLSDMLSYIRDEIRPADDANRQTLDYRDRLERMHEACLKLRPYVSSAMDYYADRGEFETVAGLDELLYKSLLLCAVDFFDDYLQAVEYWRPFGKKFYLPRRHYLKRYVDAYQEVLDGKLDFLSMSIPKRCGKSQMGINFVDMISGRKPNNATLMEGTGDALVKSFYKGCMEYLAKGSEYSYYDIFPRLKISETNADMKTINLDRKSRFPTIMCRSIDSSQVGLSEATNLLYLDDCVEGREEAKNRTRLDAKWEVISGDILGRAIEGTPIVICGTRYSLYDPIGRLQETMREQGKRMKVLEIPALDPVTDESNFEYIREGQRVFTTEYFRNQRTMLSAEQWESEFQQQPFEAKGLMFPKDQLNYYYELPVDKDPDTIVCVCDTAEDGSDFCSMPIARVYGDEIYIDAVVFDDSPAMVTKPECAKAIIDNNVVSGTFESNNAGSYFARDVQDILKERGYKCGIRTKRTISNKQTRIEFASDNIIKHFWFKHPSTYRRGGQYDMFMRQVTTRPRSGKVEHDAGPDSLAMLENELRGILTPAVEVFKRPV